MSGSTAARRLDEPANADRVIKLDTPEAQVYSNILSLVERPSISHLDEDTLELTRSILNVTFTLSKRSISDTYQAVVYAVLDWERWQEAADDGMEPSLLAYNTLVTDFKASLKDNGHKELTKTLLQRMIPFSYAVWAATCLTAAAVFLTMFAYGLFRGIFVIGPWLNLMLCVGSVGLSATVLTAIADWRLEHNGRNPKR